jgi:hypothetical protein
VAVDPAGTLGRPHSLFVVYMPRAQELDDDSSIICFLLFMLLCKFGLAEKASAEEGQAGRVAVIRGNGVSLRRNRTSSSKGTNYCQLS